MTIISRAALRILLLKTTKRPLVSPTIPERDFDPTTLPPPSSATSSPTLAPTSNVPSRLGTPDHLRNNHIPFEPHPLLLPSSSHSETSAEEYLAGKALTTASVKPSFSLLRKLSGPRDYLAEIIYILRPLVYGKSAVFMIIGVL
jgi:peroxin-16